MQHDDVKRALKAWGDATVNRYAVCRSDRSTHQLDKARDMAPGTRENAAKRLADRDGRSRRATMAVAATHGARMKMQAVPKWACEPIRASNDADQPKDHPEIAVDMGIPDELLWIEHAVCQMERQHPMRALIVRTEFTINASQQVKARMVQEQYGGSLTVWQYRAELDRAIAWIGGARDAA
jgi:hypothetical protein